MISRLMSSAIAIAALTALLACTAVGGPPQLDVDPARHGNLAAAQQLVLNAYNRVSDAQVANDYQLGGHAARAKQLLSEASAEIAMSAEVANRW